MIEENPAVERYVSQHADVAIPKLSNSDTSSELQNTHPNDNDQSTVQSDKSI